MAQAPSRQKLLAGRHLLAALVLAVLASCAGSSVVAGAYASCDVGVNATANAFGLVVVLPVLVIAHGAALIGAYAVTGRWVATPALRAGISALTTVVVVVALSWAYLALAGLPLQNALCPAGEPPWWPHWLPPTRDVYP